MVVDEKAQERHETIYSGFDYKKQSNVFKRTGIIVHLLVIIKWC
jgi:hypothetical protein